MHFKMMALAASVSFTLPAVAQTAEPAAPPPPKEKKSCRREAVTGSIVSVRAVCHTKSEWAAIDADNAKNADAMLGGTRTPR
jgi:predicted secreted protein